MTKQYILLVMIFLGMAATLNATIYPPSLLYLPPSYAENSGIQDPSYAPNVENMQQLCGNRPYAIHAQFRKINQFKVECNSDTYIITTEAGGNILYINDITDSTVTENGFILIFTLLVIVMCFWLYILFFIGRGD